MTIALNSIFDSWLSSISFSILYESSSFPFVWGLFLCLSVVSDTLLVSFCFLICSVLTSWVCGVNLYGWSPLRISGAVYLIWTCCSWDFIYIASLDVCGFWLFLCYSLVGPSLQLVDCGSLCPPHLVRCCAGADRLCWSWFFSVSKVMRLLSRYCSVVCSG